MACSFTWLISFEKLFMFIRFLLWLVYYWLIMISWLSNSSMLLWRIFWNFCLFYCWLFVYSFPFAAYKLLFWFYGCLLWILLFDPYLFKIPLPIPVFLFPLTLPPPSPFNSLSSLLIKTNSSFNSLFSYFKSVIFLYSLLFSALLYFYF